MTADSANSRSELVLFHFALEKATDIVDIKATCRVLPVGGFLRWTVLSLRVVFDLVRHHDSVADRVQVTLVNVEAAPHIQTRESLRHIHIAIV